jgi:hypothetical protein
MTRAPVILVAVAALAAGAVLLGAPAPAVAEEGSMVFERGDAPAGIDITGLSVDNADRRFSMQVQVRNLAKTGGRFDFNYWGGPIEETPPNRSLLIIVKSVEGHARAKFLKCDRDVCLRDRCLGLIAHWDEAADRVSVSAPQRCYPRGYPAPVPLGTGRFFASSERGRDFDYGQSEPLQLTRG